MCLKKKGRKRKGITEKQVKESNSIKSHDCYNHSKATVTLETGLRCSVNIYCNFTKTPFTMAPDSVRYAEDSIRESPVTQPQFHCQTLNKLNSGRAGAIVANKQLYPISFPHMVLFHLK